jgi:cytochrome c-type biogenesis protein CcmF
MGLALGSWWAYYELGWGGWWFWDPTENAALMPWLAGTALIHSLAVTDRRGSFRAWTVLLAITTFALSLLGTFLVRSGVLSSVHAFATDPARGVFILVLLTLVIGGSLLLFALRAARVGPGGIFELLSRESLLLVNNLLLLTAAGSVLLGTLYPLFLDALGFGKISVGPPYFDAVFVPLAVPLLFLVGVGPAARWRGESLPDLARRLRGAGLVSVVAATVAVAMLDTWRPLAGLGLFLALWIAATAASGVVERVRRARGGWLERLLAQSTSFYGMTLAHLGVAAAVVGVSLVSGFESEQDVRMKPGDTVPLAGLTLRFDGLSRVEGPNYLAARGEFTVVRPDASTFALRPEKRLYNASGMTMTEAAIDPGVTRDIYISLGQPLGGGAWSVRVYHKPFVSWIWFGALLAVTGGVLALSDRRYRLRRQGAYRGAARSACSETAATPGSA